MSRKFSVACAVGALVVVACQKDAPTVDATAERQEANGLYLAATDAYFKGEFKKAIGLFAQVRAKFPGDPRLPGAEAEALLADGRIDDALARFEEALKLDPNRSTTHSRLGFIYLVKGKTADARKELELALKLNPNDSLSWQTLAEIDQKQGRRDEAVEHLRKAMGLAQRGEKSAIALDAAKLLRGDSKVDAAVEILAEAIDGGAGTVEVYTELGEALVSMHRLTDARDAYVGAAKLTKEDPSLWELAAEIDLKLKNYPAAESEFREANQARPSATAWAGLARVAMARKDAAGAKEALDKALASATGEDLRESLELADVLEKVGRVQDASKLLQTVAAEEDNAGEMGIQLRAARLAKLANDAAAVAAACGRARNIDAGVKKCP